jgi:hypothetical protein
MLKISTGTAWPGDNFSASGNKTSIYEGKIGSMGQQQKCHNV